MRACFCVLKWLCGAALGMCYEEGGEINMGQSKGSRREAWVLSGSLASPCRVCVLALAGPPSVSGSPGGEPAAARKLSWTVSSSCVYVKAGGKTCSLKWKKEIRSFQSPPASPSLCPLAGISAFPSLL